MSKYWYQTYYREKKWCEWKWYHLISAEKEVEPKQITELLETYFLPAGGEVFTEMVPQSTPVPIADITFEKLMQLRKTYAKPRMKRKKQITELYQKIKSLQVKRSKLVHTISWYDEQLCKEYNHTPSRISANSKHLPPTTPIVRCKFCRTPVEHELEHYQAFTPGVIGEELWSCRYVNHW